MDRFEEERIFIGRINSGHSPVFFDPAETVLNGKPTEFFIQGLPGVSKTGGKK